VNAQEDFIYVRARRKQWCVDLLGAGVVALHAAAVPAGYRPGPLYWRNLWFAGHRMDQVRWWRKGSHQLKLRAAQVSALRLLNVTLPQSPRPLILHILSLAPVVVARVSS
jgi:hypothetical protein